MSGRVALVTGISGQDGSYLAEQLLDKGYAVHGLVREGRLGLVEHLAGRLTVHEGDMRDGATIARAVAGAAPDEVYHLAGPSRAGRSWENPEEVFDVVAAGTVRLLGAVAAHAPAARTFVASSSEAFGPSAEPADETAPFAPRNPYGAAKAAATCAARAWRAGRGLWVSVGFLFNHESPRRPLDFVTRKITWHAAALAAGQDVTLRLGNLDAQRDWGYAPEYMDGAWRALQADAAGDYVFATGAKHSVAELLEIAFAHAGVGTDRVEIDPSLTAAGHEQSPDGDPSKARRELGWAAAMPFEQLIRTMVDADREAAA